MTKHLIPHHTSPFESIKQVENGHEYWSGRNLQTLVAIPSDASLLMLSTGRGWPVRTADKRLLTILAA